MGHLVSMIVVRELPGKSSSCTHLEVSMFHRNFQHPSQVGKSNQCFSNLEDAERHFSYEHMISKIGQPSAEVVPRLHCSDRIPAVSVHNKDALFSKHLQNCPNSYVDLPLREPFCFSLLKEGLRFNRNPQEPTLAQESPCLPFPSLTLP